MKKLLLVFCLFLFCTCKTKYIEVPKVQTEYIVKQNIDTIIKHDSVFLFDSISTYTLFDTVYKDKFHTVILYKNNYITKYRTDTLHRIDSIPYKVDTIKYVNKTNTVLNILIYIGLFTIVALLVYIGIKVFRK